MKYFEVLFKLMELCAVPGGGGVAGTAAWTLCAGCHDPLDHAQHNICTLQFPADLKALLPSHFASRITADMGGGGGGGGGGGAAPLPPTTCSRLNPPVLFHDAATVTRCVLPYKNWEILGHGTLAKLIILCEI